ncbi:MAG: hypothetical protein JWO38_4334, partial [Gemmataceae bacterium]|nr:hypothetical protein [Gemmataceae bacterium]
EGRGRPLAATNPGDGRRVDRSCVVVSRVVGIPSRATKVGHHPALPLLFIRGRHEPGHEVVYGPFPVLWRELRLEPKKDGDTHNRLVLFPRNRNINRVPDRLAGNLSGIAVEPDYLLDIDMVFSFFSPLKGYNNWVDSNSKPIAKNYGHNNMPYAGNRSQGKVVSGDSNAGRWFIASRDGALTDPTLLEYYNFQNLFNSWQNGILPPPIIP